MAASVEQQIQQYFSKNKDKTPLHTDTDYNFLKSYLNSLIRLENKKLLSTMKTLNKRKKLKENPFWEDFRDWYLANQESNSAMNRLYYKIVRLMKKTPLKKNVSIDKTSEQEEKRELTSLFWKLMSDPQIISQKEMKRIKELAQKLGNINVINYLNQRQALKKSQVASSQPERQSSTRTSKRTSISTATPK